ncbi:MAG: thiol reductase thioredoxin [Candidatus Sericytochromatia bacterium]|nr:MAG: thiol reductase thioredoxin [Candidatus Sericytochromatia bacterium]
MNKIKILCKNCSKINLVEKFKIDDNPICGNCKAKLEIPESPINVTANNFEIEVLKHPGIILLDFWATWCQPCRMIAPILNDIAKEKKGEIKIGKIDTDKEILLASQFQISSIPTLILFYNGKVINRVSGAMSKQNLINWINSSLVSKV